MEKQHIVVVISIILILGLVYYYFFYEMPNEQKYQEALNLAETDPQILNF